MQFRVGFGYDVHRLVAGRRLVLGGCDLKHETGTLGHSDGDALIHAICDALLGALALRDIGHHFPDTDPDYHDIDSTVLLAKTVTLIQKKGWVVNNIDATIILEKPKINPHVDRMISTLAPILGIEAGQLSIKATTSEKMGFVGREEGVAVYCICSLTNSAST